MRHTVVQMFKSHAVAIAMSQLVFLSGAAAQNAELSPTPVVVELFTSQGCSSCPPADAVLNELAARDDVIALALHVDYWDYIGWKDVFADPQYTVRQRAYARSLGERMVYTPQMIVQGQKPVVGYKPALLADAIEQNRKVADNVPVILAATRTEQGVRIDISASGDLPELMLVQLVEFEPNEVVDITRGENRGKTIAYSNIVKSWKQIAEWSGSSAMSVTTDVSSDLPVAVLLQEVQAEGPGAILAAIRVD